jgi:hypothetical protein
VRTANDQLRQARERLPSGQVPGACASRQELAELVNRWVFEGTGRIVELDDNYVGKLERGVIRWPCRLYRDALRAILQAGTDAQLGFYAQRRRSVSVNTVDRQHFLQMSGATLALGVFGPLQPTPLPARIGRTEIEQVRTAAQVFFSWDNRFGGDCARDAAFAQLRWATRLLHAECPEALRPDLFSAVAQLAGRAGFMAYDALAHDDARRAFDFALACAEQSGDQHQRARTHQMLAQQALFLGRPDESLTHTELALVRGDRLSATERAMLHAERAYALAVLGRVSETVAAVGAADAAFAHTNPPDDPPMIRYYTVAQHHGITGRALSGLAQAAGRAEAATRLAYAVRHQSDEYARSRTGFQIRLASVTMAVGDPREAAAIGTAALDALGELRSRRTMSMLTELHRYAGRHPHITEAVELRDRLASVDR